MELIILSIAASVLFGFVCFLFMYVFFNAIYTRYLLYRTSYMRKYKEIFDSLFMKVNLEKFATYHMILTLVIPVGIYFLTGKLFLAVLLGVVTYMAPRLRLMKLKRKRLERLDMQILNALGLIGNALKAGLTLSQAFNNVKEQMSPPISDEFSLILREYSFGIPFDTALMNFTKRVPSNNVDTFVSSILTSRKSGGDIAEVLEKMGDSMKEIFRLEGKIDALTSQGKAQAFVLGGLPFGFGLILYFIDPTMIVPLITTPQGYAICIVIGIFWAIGMFFIWKIINVEV